MGHPQLWLGGSFNGLLSGKSFARDDNSVVAGEKTAGPSTALRSGRDDNSVVAGWSATEHWLTTATTVIPTGA